MSIASLPSSLLPSFIPSFHPGIPPLGSCRDLLFPPHHFEMSHEGLSSLPHSLPPSLLPAPSGSGLRPESGVRGELFSAAQLYKEEERARIARLTNQRAGSIRILHLLSSQLDESLPLSSLFAQCVRSDHHRLSSRARAPLPEAGGGADFIRNTSCGNITHNELYLCRRQRASEAAAARAREVARKWSHSVLESRNLSSMSRPNPFVQPVGRAARAVRASLSLRRSCL